MTQDEVVNYLERLMPTLRQKVGVKSLREGDAFQKTMFALLEKAPTLVIHDDNEFIKTFRGFYWWRMRREWRLDAERDQYYSDVFDGEPPPDGTLFIKDNFSCNPFDNPTTNALEYIELINDPLLKRIAFLYYIEGYTLEEVGFMYGHQKKWAHRKTQEVVRAIQIGIAIHCSG